MNLSMFSHELLAILVVCTLGGWGTPFSEVSTQFIHQCDQNFNDSQMYISAVNLPLVFMFSVRRQMSPVSARRVAFVFRDFPIGFI